MGCRSSAPAKSQCRPASTLLKDVWDCNAANEAVTAAHPGHFAHSCMLHAHIDIACRVDSTHLHRGQGAARSICTPGVLHQACRNFCGPCRLLLGQAVSPPVRLDAGQGGLLHGLCVLDMPVMHWLQLGSLMMCSSNRRPKTQIRRLATQVRAHK